MKSLSAVLTLFVSASECVLAFGVEAQFDDSISLGAFDVWYFFFETVEHGL